MPAAEFYLKERLVEEDEFLVLACDGVWDVMTNEDICQFVAARMRITDDLELIANEVIDTCLHKVGKRVLFCLWLIVYDLLLICLFLPPQRLGYFQIRY